MLAAALTSSKPTAATKSPASAFRDLEFGDINFLHTTDTHGWHAGHLLEPSYNANWGDYISFSEHLRTKLEADGKDLLIVDSGDRIEGNGLYDSSNPRGKYTFGIFSQQNIDLLCIGNHELYKNTSAIDDFTKLVPAYAENYIASNLKILDPKSGKLVPFAQTHRKFTTKNGLRILAFGFIFDFDRNDKDTVITPVEITIKEPWFQDAIADKDVDLIVVVGHIALRQQEFENIHKAIRSVNASIPIQFLGGHYHIRDYRIFDDRSQALASGRFMETIGFQSISNLKSGKPQFFRRYIDNNLASFKYHSNTTDDTFHTKSGITTTKMIDDARKALKLDHVFGYAPQTYWMTQVPYDDTSSVFSLLVDKVFPDIVQPARSNRTRMMITNTGAIRFDIFAGAFTRDSTFIVSPFTSNFSYIPDVPYRLAKQLLPILNNGNPQVSLAWEWLHYAQCNKLRMEDLAPPEERARRTAMELAEANGQEQHKQTLPQHSKGPGTAFAQVPLSAELTPGYTTHDDLGSEGDDTPHSVIPVYAVPNCVQALFPGSNSSITADLLRKNKDIYGMNHLPYRATSQDDEMVDLIFNQFLTPYILKLLNLLPYLDPHYEGKLAYDHDEYKHNAAWAITNLRDIDIGGDFWAEDMDKYRRIDIRHVELGLHADLAPPKRSRYILGAMEARDEIDCSDEELKQRMEDDKRPKAERPVWAERDVQNYMPGETFTTLLEKWVSQNWAEKYQNGHELQQADPEL